jgi:hypothetical protein
MGTLYLHIGHSKTGSSWIQSSLARSQVVLAHHGIMYPRTRPDDPAGTRQIAFGGNGKTLLRSPAIFRKHLAASGLGDSPAVLFSSEYMMEELRKQPLDLKSFLEAARGHGLEQIKVLLFIREPVEHAASTFQQQVKAGKRHDTIDAWFAQYDRPVRFSQAVENLARYPEVALTVRNYSVCRQRLLAEVEDWLGLSKGTLERPPVGRVNRSLTAGELVLQTALNRRLGRSSRFLGTSLVEQLPNIEPELIWPTREAQEAMLERLRPAMEQINARVPEAHRYRYEIREPATRSDYGFTAEQLELIGDLFGRAVAGDHGVLLTRLPTRYLLGAIQQKLVRGLRRRVGRKALRKLLQRT